MNKKKLEQLLNTYGIQPRREQGQNFLIDPVAVLNSIEAANLTQEDTVLEIGPGFGVLTQEIAARAGKLIAVEQDRVLTRAAMEQTTEFDNVTIVNEDIRTAHLAELGLEDMKYKLVANLPYSITSWIMRHFLENSPRPSEMVVMIQKDVADRILATPGKMSLLAVATQLYADVERVYNVPPGSFFPPPKVMSAIIKLTLKPETLSQNPKQLMRVAKMGFAAKRKQLHNTIASGLSISGVQAKELLSIAGIKETIRPQELSIEEWERLRVHCQPYLADEAH